MDSHELPFAKITILRDDIAEVIINDGIEMDVSMVEQYHKFLLSHLRSPFSLLINKVNSYTYDFQSQKTIAVLKEINAIAIVAYNRMTEITTQSLAAVPRNIEWNMKIFPDRDNALLWLESEQDKSKK